MRLSCLQAVLSAAHIHIDLRKDNVQGSTFWWSASACRHLGAGGTHSDPAAHKAHRDAMATCAQVDSIRVINRFNLQGSTRTSPTRKRRDGSLDPHALRRPTVRFACDDALLELGKASSICPHGESPHPEIAKALHERGSR